MNRKLLVALLLSVSLLSLGSFVSASVNGPEAIVVGSGGGLLAKANDTITIEAKDIAFVPTEITIDASDEPVTITMKNTGAALHNFSIDSLGVDVDVNPGETVDFEIPAGTAPGTYDFYCNVPAHKEAGMVGTLTVVAMTSSDKPTVSAAAATVEAVAEKTAAAGQESAGDVPMFRGNPARTGEMPGTGPEEQPGAIWTFRMQGNTFSSPAVSDGIVYVGSDDGTFYALEADSGHELWSFAAQERIRSSPAVANGIVYFGSDDNFLYAVEALTGELAWSFDSTEFSGGDFASSPLVVDNTVYVGGGSYLYALDSATGQRKWSFFTDGFVFSSPAYSDGIVYVGSHDHYIYAIEASTGSEKWSRDAGGQVSSSPAISDGTVYVGVSGSDYVSYGGVLALDAKTGNSRWSLSTESPVGSSPAVANEIVIALDVNAGMRALDANTGSLLWEASGGVYSSPAIVGSTVYVGTSQGIRALDITSGSESWVYDSGYSSDTSPVVTGGVVYAVNEEGTVVALSVNDEIRTQVAESNASATAEASATAVQQALEVSWSEYFQTIGNSLSESGIVLPGVTIDSAPQSCPGEQIPSSFEYCESYEASIAGGNGSTWTALAIYALPDEAKAAIDQMKGGLSRSGWKEQDVDGLDHDHICLTFVHDETSQGICYMTRDDALIVSYSNLDVDAPEAVLQNAVDLANAMNDAYDQVDRPD